ncbi:MAG: hypothetical protein KDD64_15705 [Bdellovibrionales bacterium]|nr:hypothetical protein [Bdellovibrionales bacterium]
MKFLHELLARTGIKSHDNHLSLPRADRFRQIDMGVGAVSIEEAMFLYGLVGIVKPDVVIELGTAEGASAVFLAAACADFGAGKVFSIDYAEAPPAIALKLSQELELPLQFECGTRSLEWLERFSPSSTSKYLVFSDTEMKIRPDEVLYVKEKFPQGTCIAVHDTASGHPYGPMNLAERIGVDVLELPSPRGLSILIS